MMNNGKRFENNFKNSVPNNVWYYRFRDGTASWSNSDVVRFQQNNICDCLLYHKGQLTLCELKSTEQASLPLSNIRQSQLDDMLQASLHGVNTLFIIKIRDIVYAVDVESVDEFIKNNDRKSIPLSWLEEYGILIPSTKLKVNYRYDLEVIL